MARELHLEVPGDPVRVVRLSNPDRPLWPADEHGPAITKADLAAYVLALGDPLLAAVHDRPVTLQRFPAGIHGEEFYQKNPPTGLPDWVATEMVRYPSGRRHAQVVVDSLAAIVYAVQLGTVTLHPWPVRTADTDRPDELRIDLDPQAGRGFADAVEAAHALREVLAEAGLTGWVKTSGNRGVHVFARIVPEHEFLDVRHAVIALARELERRLPDLVTTSWWKEERGERVFVDFNQACRDRTLASAYSPRPLAGAPVSMPVSWDDLGRERPEEFTVRTVPAIVAERGHPWSGINAAVGSLATALQWWEADVERGLGELNFPPDYPKMPGEPPRVPPSKRRSDKADEDYLAPKAQRDAAHRQSWGLPVVPPVLPMLAKPVAGLTARSLPGEGVSFEPKWDGFRSIIWRSGDRVEIGSRNDKPMTRYFPEVVAAVLAHFPQRAVVDGEIIVRRPGTQRLDFELLAQRIHPAASRVRLLAEQTPAAFVGFDLLALGDRDLMTEPFSVRRALLEEAFAHARAPVHITPITTDRDEAARWFTQFEGAGLDGLVAKLATGPYEPGKRTMFKIKHTRTADCVVAGYRPHKSSPELIGSLLLGLYDDGGELHNVGVIGAFPMATRAALFTEFQPLVTTGEGHPWSWGAMEDGTRTPTSGATSRWNAGKDLSFVPVRPERVVEIRYDHMEGARLRHTGQFVRWRPDKEPADCTYDQLDEPVSYDLDAILGERP